VGADAPVTWRQGEVWPVKTVVLWNTRYTDAAVAEIRGQGNEIADEDAARLSPLADAHIKKVPAATRSCCLTWPAASARCATRTPATTTGSKGCR
jgi:hypothetical protein